MKAVDSGSHVTVGESMMLDVAEAIDLLKSLPRAIEMALRFEERSASDRTNAIKKQRSRFKGMGIRL